MHALRLAVCENVLESLEVTEASYVPTIVPSLQGMRPNEEVAYEFGA